MTEIEIERINDLRSKGCGYKSIAKELGLPENTVKSYCRRHSVEKTICDNCGVSFPKIKGRKPKRFCCDACRAKWWNAHLHLVKRKAVYSFVCEACGTTFEAYGNNHRKFCSHACYVKFRFGGGNDD